MSTSAQCPGGGSGECFKGATYTRHMHRDAETKKNYQGHGDGKKFGEREKFAFSHSDRVTADGPRVYNNASVYNGATMLEASNVVHAPFCM